MSGAVTRDFARGMDSLGDVFRFVDHFLTEHSASERCAYAIRLAIEEVFTNFVKYNSESSAPIQIEMAVDAGAVMVTLRDEEESPFDLTRQKEIDTAANLDRRKPGGLGIHLIKRMLDAVEYSYADGLSTILLTKRLQD